MIRELIAGTVLMVLLTATNDGGAQSAAPASDGSAALPADGVQAFRIGPEDMLHIAVWKDETMSRTVPVRPDGVISLPLLNDVRAAGLTPTELRTVLMKRLAEYMPDPEVSVIVTDVKSFKVSVIGEVARPLRYELKSWTTVLDVLAMAGGFTHFALRSKISVLRTEGNTIKRIPFNYPKVVSGQEEDFYLRPGDKVLVP